MNAHAPLEAPLARLLRHASIEVLPRTAPAVADLPLPAGTRVCIAHVDGTPIEDMVEAAARVRAAGHEPMPHVPARSVADRATLERWIGVYQEAAGVREALVIAGGATSQAGEYHASMQLLDTGLFDRAGFTALHVAGHPEGNRDIDPDGGVHNVSEALRWKQGFQGRTDASMAIVTQFAFEAAPVVDWARSLRQAGITLPLHVGVAGPAKLQTLIKYAALCGVGASVRVLRRRAMDLRRLLQPYEPTEVAMGLARAPAGLIDRLHVFPLGGVVAAGRWIADNR
jgi:methylenetetrahydrofolate reductase (NADPH)